MLEAEPALLGFTGGVSRIQQWSGMGAAGYSSFLRAGSTEE